MLLTHWSVHVLKQHQPASRAALRSEHSRPCQLKSHQKPQGIIRRRILPVKATEKGSSKAWWCTQSADTHSSVSGEGSGLGQPGRRSGPGAAAPAELGRKGPTEGHVSCHSDQPRAGGALSCHLTWPHLPILPCQLPFPQALSTLQEPSPSARQKFWGFILSLCPWQNWVIYSLQIWVSKKPFVQILW